jgi:hypothetical protein
MLNQLGQFLLQHPGGVSSDALVAEFDSAMSTEVGLAAAVGVN